MNDGVWPDPEDGGCSSSRSPIGATWLRPHYRPHAEETALDLWQPYLEQRAARAGAASHQSLRQLAPPAPRSLEAAWQRPVLEVGEPMSVRILELDRPATGRFGDGREHLHAALRQGLDGRINAAFVQAEHDLR